MYNKEVYMLLENKKANVDVVDCMETEDFYFIGVSSGKYLGYSNDARSSLTYGLANERFYKDDIIKQLSVLSVLDILHCTVLFKDIINNLCSHDYDMTEIILKYPSSNHARLVEVFKYLNKKTGSFAKSLSNFIPLDEYGIIFKFLDGIINNYAYDKHWSFILLGFVEYKEIANIRQIDSSIKLLSHSPYSSSEACKVCNRFNELSEGIRVAEWLIGFTIFPEPQLSTLLYNAFDVVTNGMFNKDLFLCYVKHYGISEQLKKSIESLGSYYTEHGFTYVVKELLNKLRSLI